MSDPHRPLWKRIAAISGSILATAFLLNPTLGIFELIPDVLPIVGNLDEAAATGLLLYCLRYAFRRPVRDAP